MYPGNPKDGDSTASLGSLSQGCRTLVVNEVLPLLRKDFAGWQHETLASCPFTVHLQEKLGGVGILIPPLQQHLCNEIPLQWAFPSAGQTNLIPISSPHTAHTPAGLGAVLEPLQCVSISHTMGCVCLKTARGIADAASPEPGWGEWPHPCTCWPLANAIPWLVGVAAAGGHCWHRSSLFSTRIPRLLLQGCTPQSVPSLP